MLLREKQEAFEHQFLSPLATFSDMSKGKAEYEAPCDIRTIFQRDRDSIIHSKSFRRLKDKTQVFLQPEGDHYRNRLTHTLEVSQISRTIAKALRLNEDLTEAIALGHDLGHTPFGHAGERALNDICEDGFEHAVQSIRVVELLERDFRGLNLTCEVKDGILNHQSKGNPSTLEGKIVRFSDKIAYINHDIDDAIRGRIITEEDIPKEYTAVLGSTVKERLNTLIHDIIITSEKSNDIKLSAEIEKAMFDLRKFMFQSVYTNKKAKGEEGKAESMVKFLYEYYLKNIQKLPSKYQELIYNKNHKASAVVCDYIAGMTDHYAITKYSEITIPSGWRVF